MFELIKATLNYAHSSNYQFIRLYKQQETSEIRVERVLNKNARGCVSFSIGIFRCEETKRVVVYRIFVYPDCYVAGNRFKRITLRTMYSR